ncbi:MAG TPA: hypothetical protein VF306_09825 [Pirellulales bacterium]
MRRIHFFAGVLTGLLLALAFQTAVKFWHRPLPAAARFTAPAFVPQPAATAPLIIEDAPMPSPSIEHAVPPSWTPRWFNGRQYYIVPLS